MKTYPDSTNKTVGIRSLHGDWAVFVIQVKQTPDGTTIIPLDLSYRLPNGINYKFSGFSRQGRLLYKEAE